MAQGENPESDQAVVVRLVHRPAGSLFPAGLYLAEPVDLPLNEPGEVASALGFSASNTHRQKRSHAKESAHLNHRQR